MSSTTPPKAAAVDNRPTRVVVISRSPIFYWWPVWAVGFLMAGLTYWQGYPVALVPAGSEAKSGQQVVGLEGLRDVVVAPPGGSMPVEADSDLLKQPGLRMTASNGPGIVWALTLCLVVIITHVELRGLWSIIAVLLIVFVTVLFAFLEWWIPIFRAIKVIDIHLTALSYLSISAFLFVIWLLALLVFDRLVYMVFSRGQLRVRMAIGAGETVYDTRGMVVEKHRAALFRHWLLGFGSGDITVRTSGTNSRQLELPNVLFINHKLALIQTMLQEREVVRASP
jgi:hypothetical protein